MNITYTKELRSYFVQSMIRKGNLYKANKLFKIVLKNLYFATKYRGLEYIRSAVHNSRVFFYLKRYYRGGASYFIPAIITNGSEEKRAVKTLLKNSSKFKQTILVGLSIELYLANDFKGESIKYKNEFNLKVIKGIPYTRFLRKK